MGIAKQIGDMGEDIAEKYLKRRCWHILSRNFNVRGGEIDIIAYRFGVLAYFEVKTRRTDSYGSPAEAVDYRKIKHINTAARQFMQLYGWGGRIPVFYPFGIEKRCPVRKQRIDVIEVYLKDNSTKINHIKNWGSQL